MMMKSSGQLLVLAAFVAVAPVAASAVGRDPVGPDVFILAGQSNMSGRGAISDLSDAERTPDAAIRLYGNDGNWRDALDPLDDAVGQVDAVSADAPAAVGPGLFFARALRRQTHRPIVLVPCAKGGSSIDGWASNGGRDTLYGSCLERVRAAGGHIAGVLWYQGETDAEQPRAIAATWNAKFNALVRAFRRDLSASHLPVAFVQIADSPGPPDGSTKYPSWGLIQRQQARLHIGCSTMASATGLPLREDQLHLTTAAQRVLGAKLAGAMDALIRRGCRQDDPPPPIAMLAALAFTAFATAKTSQPEHFDIAITVDDLPAHGTLRLSETRIGVARSYLATLKRHCVPEAFGIMERHAKAAGVHLATLQPPRAPSDQDDLCR